MTDLERGISVGKFLENYLSIYSNSLVEKEEKSIIRQVNSDIACARRGFLPNCSQLISDFGADSFKQLFLESENQNLVRKILDTLVLSWGCNIRNRCEELVYSERDLTWIGVFKGYLKKDVSFEEISILDRGSWYKIEWKNLSKKGLEYVKSIKDNIPAPDISRFLFE